MEESLQMSVSPICEKDGKKYAYIQFSDGTRLAEGKIPSCEIVKNQGFTESEGVCEEKSVNSDLL